jgi:hypothetical protein
MTRQHRFADMGHTFDRDDEDENNPVAVTDLKNQSENDGAVR